MAIKIEMAEIKRVNIPRGYSPITARLKEVLKDGKEGDTILDSKLEEIAGRPVSPQTNGYSYLASAIRYCQREHGVVWLRVFKAGMIICANAEEKLEASKGDIRIISKRSHRATQRLCTVDLAKVTDAERTEILTTTAQIGMSHGMTDKKTRNLLVERQITKALDIQKLLEVFPR